jgi:hypothetical protein
MKKIYHGLSKVNLDDLKGILNTPDETIELTAINKIVNKINKSTNTKQARLCIIDAPIEDLLAIG